MTLTVDPPALDGGIAMLLRLSLCLSAGLALALLVPAPTAADTPARSDKLWLYVGTYTQPNKSKGIYRLDFDPATGQLSEPQLAGEATNPSFLAIAPDHRHLYAVGEVGDFGGQKKTGGVSAFALEPKTGDLKLLNQQPSKGADPCHIITDKAGKHVLVANYTGGSVAVLPIDHDGKLGAATAFQQHAGKSVDKSRQGEPHAHSINLDAANRFAFAADLGLDKVMIYQYDTDKGTLTANDPPSASVPPGSGPRHFAFHPSGHYAYVINEMGNTITAFQYDAHKGALTELQNISTLPKDFKGQSWTADVHVHPSGKFVYGSNRGHNSIAVFTVDEKTGKLTAAGYQDSGIKTPRNFALDPAGKYLLVANQDGDSIVVFSIDQKTGELKPTGHSAKVYAPVCLQFMPAAQ
jgi:6-phosphogluconolactonase